jgi:3-oxoacyl-[acyl-carrier protein] reductase
MRNLLEGNVALVTGSGRGIGRSIALALARYGAKVLLVARTKNELIKVQKEIISAGGEAEIFVGDVSRESDIKALVRRTVKRFKRLDILINNAGMGLFKPLTKTTADEWDQLMNINARSPFLLCREAIPFLKKQKRSFIINIVSVAGVKGYVNQSAYSASKHAAMGLTKALAREVQKFNIRVHAICSGGVDTQLIDSLASKTKKSLLMEPQEIADIVLFLLLQQGNAMIDEIHVRRSASMPWG